MGTNEGSTFGGFLLLTIEEGGSEVGKEKDRTTTTSRGWCEGKE